MHLRNPSTLLWVSHCYFRVWFNNVFFTGDGRTIIRRQTPQSDFVNQILSMFNFSADGGPGQMLTNFFTAFLNQASALFGPFLGSRGGDGINFFNQLAQQFLTVFGQVSGLWSNMVNNQLTEWRSSSLPDDNTSEFDVLEESASRLRDADKTLKDLINSDDSTNSSSIDETRQLLYQTRESLGVDRLFGSPQLASRLQSERRNAGNSQKGDEVQLSQELVRLWCYLSARISAKRQESPFTHSCSGIPVPEKERISWWQTWWAQHFSISQFPK